MLQSDLWLQVVFAAAFKVSSSCYWASHVALVVRNLPVNAGD